MFPLHFPYLASRCAIRFQLSSNFRHCGRFHSDRKCLVIIAQCFPSYRLASSPRTIYRTNVCPLLYNSQAIHQRHLSSDVLNCGLCPAVLLNIQVSCNVTFCWVVRVRMFRKLIMPPSSGRSSASCASNDDG